MKPEHQHNTVKKSLYILRFHDIDKSKVVAVGGKGANLGELSGIAGIRVPGGFCVTTEAYDKITRNNGAIDRLLDELSELKTGESTTIDEIGAKIRRLIESAPFPNAISGEIEACLTKFGEKTAFAVRSSATAEDLPTASFAGQHGSYLNIIGKEAILRHICKCWASLFTDRANNLPHSK